LERDSSSQAQSLNQTSNTGYHRNGLKLEENPTDDNTALVNLTQSRPAWLLLVTFSNYHGTMLVSAFFRLKEWPEEL
jgi:hypothetical protein